MCDQPESIQEMYVCVGGGGMIGEERGSYQTQGFIYVIFFYIFTY